LIARATSTTMLRGDEAVPIHHAERACGRPRGVRGQAACAAEPVARAVEVRV
jgi:hypothetical protein